MISQVLNIVNIAIGAVFMLCYLYQIVFLFISFFTKPKKYPETDKRYKYAFIISARNEENVISQLCDTIKAQNYPSELIETYVVADNCTDSTADVARACGANVFERNDTTQVGKGYALKALFDRIDATVGFDAFDAYIVVDADNLLDSNYVYEMNKCFASGARIITSYRNTKNYGDNWISQGYSVWFVREMRQLNAVRSVLGTTSEVRGTGFLVSKDIIKEQGGWTQHLMIEDVQFAVENVLRGETVAYCHDAIFYDEQPTSFMASWWQRKRWCRGYLQILKRYGAKLIGAFLKGRGFSNFDLFMSMSPAFFISVGAVIINVLAMILTLIFEPYNFVSVLLSSVVMMISAFALFGSVGLIAVITEWKRIHTTPLRKICSVIVFPLFMATYVPIAAASMFSGTDWKPIHHNPVAEDSGIVPLHDEAEPKADEVAEEEREDALK